MASPPSDTSKCGAAIYSSPPLSAGGILIAPPLIQAPILLIHQFLKPNKIADAAASLARKMDATIAANVDRCLRLAHLIASQNPLFHKFTSLTSEFHDFCQMQRRSYKNVNTLSNHNFAAVLPGDSVAGVVVTNGILNFLNIYNTILVVRLILTWFPSAPPAIVSPLSTLCDPYLNIFRGLIPPLGGTLDLSPILAFLLLNAFTSAAAALPAELPPAGGCRQASSNAGFFDLTSSQKKWLTRLQNSIRSKDSRNSK